MAASRTPMQQSASPLLDLPAELRNEIYIHVFAGQRIDPIYRGAGKFVCCSGPAEDIMGCTTAKEFKKLIALTHTCRQIRTETRLMPFQLSVYTMRHPYIFKDWLDMQDELVRAAVRSRLIERQRVAADKGVRDWVETWVEMVD